MLQVLQFVVGHVDVFLTILRDRQTVPHLMALEELGLTTALISRAALDGKYVNHPPGECIRLGIR